MSAKYVLGAKVELINQDGSTFEDYIITDSNSDLHRKVKATYPECKTFLVKGVDTGILKNVSQNDKPDICIYADYSGSFITSWRYSIKGVNSNKIAENYETAYILALCEKYLGVNEKLSTYILKLLNIVTAWKAD